MSKWKCGICGSEFDNFHAQGFEGTIYCPLCYYKKLYKDTELERERLNNKEEQLIRRLEDLIIVGEQVENEWAVDICKMIIEELKGSDR